MKRIIALLMAMLLISSLIPAAYGETAEEAKRSKGESVLLKKGSVITKEYVTYKSLVFSGKDLLFRTVELTDLATNQKYHGIRIEFDENNSLYTKGTGIASIDADEVDSIISMLEYVKAHQSEFVNYTEVEYKTSGGFRIGAYKNSLDTGVFLEQDGKQFLVDIKHLDRLIEYFKLGRSKIPN